MNKKYPFLLLLSALTLTSCNIVFPSINPSEQSSLPSSSEVSSEASSESSSEISSEPSSEVSSEETSSFNTYDGYYDNINHNATGLDLLGQVRDVMVEKHSTYTTYGDCRGGSSGKTDKADYDPNDPNRIIMFYTQASIPNMWDNGTTYNREHLWCQSLSNGLWEKTSNSSRGGGADLHHVRPAFSSINSARGNKPYADVNGGTEKTFIYEGKTYTAGYYDNTYWEPTDEVKGDVARILLYTFVHYNSVSNLGANNLVTGKITSTAVAKDEGNLPITNVVKGTKKEAFALLVKWNKEDPVDILETNRNQAVYKIQGNRNAFIDHPEFIDAIWG